jgi:hypothetical protein
MTQELLKARPEANSQPSLTDALYQPQVNPEAGSMQMPLIRLRACSRSSKRSRCV